MKLNTLFYDIETAPRLAHVWQAKTEYIPEGQMVDDTFMLTWSASWNDDKKIHSARVTGKQAQNNDDADIVAELAILIREADIIVAHNGDRFDLPTINSRLLMLGQDPLPPATSIDTLKLARKYFNFSHNNLNYLARMFGIGTKDKMVWEDWLAAYHGDVTALKKMEKYNKNDVVILREVFHKLRPYSRLVTRRYEAEYEGEMACPECGGEELIRRGYYRTQASTFVRYQCKNCGRYSRVRSAEKEKKLGVYPL